MRPGKIAISVDRRNAFLEWIMGNVQLMGNNAEIAGHGTIFQERLLVQEDTRDSERVIRVNLEAAEQYKYVALHAQREHQWHRLMSRL